MGRVLEFKDVYQTNIRASEGAGTTTLIFSDNRNQVFNLSASRNVVLPSVGIYKGEIFRLENTSFFDLVPKSSDTTTITDSNFGTASAGVPTIQRGYVIFEALQDTPTAPAHWKIVDVYERYAQATGTTSSALTVAFGVDFVRHNKIITATYFSATASASAAQFVNTGNILPTRFYHASATITVPCAVYQGGQQEAGVVIINTSGNMAFGRYNLANWASTSGLTNGTIPKSVISWVADYT